MIAWLQFKHKLSLDSSLYIAHFHKKKFNIKYGEPAIAIGLNHCLDFHFFNSNWDMSSKLFKNFFI